MTISGNTSRSSTPTRSVIRTQFDDDFSISFTPPTSPRPLVELQTQLSIIANNELLAFLSLPLPPFENDYSPIQSRASSPIQPPTSLPTQQTAPTNNLNAQDQLNLEKAFAFGYGFGNNRTNASTEELEQGFQSFMANLSKSATGVEVKSEVASKPAL